MSQRIDGRRADELRPLRLTRGYNKYAEGSVLAELGDTRLLVTATIDEKVPPFLRGTGKGWVTAEYAMLPRATAERNQREATRGQIGGRTMEIQRLVGRALRSVVDMDALGERTFVLDCDVLQADGGTRTAAITGAFVALVDALARLGELVETGQLSASGGNSRNSSGSSSLSGEIAGWGTKKPLPLRDFIAATSVGIVGGQTFLDLRYAEDSRAEVDMNVVMTGEGRVVEVQGTAEREPFSRDSLNELLDLASRGIAGLIEQQKAALGALAARVGNWKAAPKR